MPQYTDCYYLVKSRSSSICMNFLDKYFPHREYSSDEFTLFDDDGKLKKSFNSIEDLIEYLEKDKFQDSELYWKNLDSSSLMNHAMIFYLDDSNMVLGFSTCKSRDSHETLKLYKEVQNFLNSNHCCITEEEAPPYNSDDFIEFCKERFNP